MVEYERSQDDWYRWVVLVSGTFTMIFTFGTPLSYGIFMTPFHEAFDLSRAALSTVFSVMLFAFYAGAGVISIYATKLPSRAVLVACGIVAAAVSPLLFVVEAYAAFLVIFGLLGGAIGTVFVMLASIVPQWFDERRGFATGILFTGNGSSLLVLPPAWQFVFESFGVRTGFLGLVALSAFAFLIAGAFCRRPPVMDRSSATLTELGRWVSNLFSDKQFYLLFVGKGLAFTWYYLLAAYAVDLFVDRGLTASTAAAVFGLIGGVSIVSRIGSGTVADQIGHRRTFFLSMASTAVGGVLLLVPSIVAVVAAVILFGIGLGGIATLYIPILLQVYDPHMSTAIVGLFNVGTGAFALLAPLAVLVALNYGGSYAIAIMLTIGASVGAILSFWFGLRADGSRTSDR